MTVININEIPVLVAASTASVAENTTRVLTASATDPEDDSIAFSLNGTDARFFEISAGGVVTFKTIPDFETKNDNGSDNVYNFNIVVADVLGRTDSQAVAVTVTDVDEFPVLTASSTASVAENTTSVLTVSTTGVDNITYSLAGIDAGFFSISASSFSVTGSAAGFVFTTGGTVIFNTAPDFETKNDNGSNNIYDIIIVATDALGLTDTQAVAVTVTEVKSFSGTSGNDLLSGGAGDDQFDGGLGTDAVVFTGNRTDYSITNSGSQVIVSDLQPGRDGTDTLTNIERLSFLDGTLALDTSGNAGQTYRLYQAAFGRVPDTGGLSVNVNLLDTVLSLHDISDAFVFSAEFISLYGANFSNETFITALYQNVLDRLPDEGGFNGWNDLLESGQLDRADVLIGFSESPENIVLVGTAIENGIWLG